MLIREEFEKREKSFMSPFGYLSSESRGRMKEEEPCPVRTAFQQDKDRIVYSNAFRRLKHKTQVFLTPLCDEYRTRLTHTLEVAQISRTIARAMFFNEDLAEAIALGHDLGHTPFGHSGEVVLQEIYSRNFSHPKQSLRVVDILENNGKGLNLTYEVRDGILKHSKGYGLIFPDDPDEQACTIEGRIVRLADIMAYVNHDLDDAIRSGVINEEQIPESCSAILGHNYWERSTTMVKDLIFSSKFSKNEQCLRMSDKVYSAVITLREFLYENVYRSPIVHKEFVKAKKVLSELYAYFLNDEEMLKKELEGMEIRESDCDVQSNERLACDFVASMTDRYALNLYTEIFFPSPVV